MRGIGLHDRAKPVDVDVDRAGLAGVVVAPDLLEELVATDDLPWMAEEEGEQVEDLRLYREDLAVPEHAMAREVHLDPPELDDRWELRRSRRPLAASEDRANPCRELAGAERLRDVIVRAELQPDDLVDLRITRREHHDRHARFSPNLARHFEAGKLRQHEVEQDEVRRGGAGPLPGSAAVSRPY